MRDEGEMDFRRGFTLVEILIALVVLGILLVAATSTFRETGDKYRAESETKQLFADLTDARARAMQRSRIFFVRLRTTGYETFEDTNTGPDGNGSLETASDAPAARAAVRHTINTTNLAGTDLVGGAPTFRFDRGGIASATGNIRLLSDNNPDYDCIVIAPTRIKMGKYEGSACVER